MKTQSIGPFAGINNRLPDFALGATKEHAAFLADAVNVDVTNAGNLVRRKALERVQAMSGAHSLYADYLVRGAVLYRITLPAYTETLVKVLSSDEPMSYVEFNGDLYYSNGEDSGRITSDGTLYPMALPTPTEPAVSSGAGALHAGQYQVAVSYTNSTTGEEGGVSASNNYTLAATGSLVVSLPAATPGATHINVYVSTLNGSIPLLQTSVATGTASVTINSIAIGREASQRYEAPLPAGQLFLFNGCLCSHRGGDVFEGIPYRPGYYLPAEGRIPFPGDVSNAVPAQNGVYIVADKTYWLQGPRMTTAEVIQDVLPYGGVPGTAFSSPNKSLYGWFSEKGIVLGTPQGEVQAVMSDNIDLVPPSVGVSVLLQTRGYRRVVSCGWCLNLDNLSATRYEGYDLTSAYGGYGTMEDGLYKLEGTGLVDWSARLGKQNFGAENLKHMPAVYLGAASDEPLSLQIQTPQHDYTYAARTCSDDIKMQRVDPGKGLRSNWFDLTLLGTTDFTLASVSFGPVASQRRI